MATVIYSIDILLPIESQTWLCMVVVIPDLCNVSWVQQRINIFIHYNGSSSFCPNLWERELWKPSVALISPRYWNVLFHSAAIMPILFTLLITQMSNFPFVIVLKDFSVVPLTYMSTELIHVFLWFLYWCSVQGSKPHPPFSMSGSVEPLSPMIPIEQFLISWSSQ